MKNLRLALLVVIVMALAVLAACDSVPQPEPTAVPAAPDQPNLAAVFCAEQGGTVDIRTAADGSQAGVCVFPDGSECDEWAFFRGECKPGDNASATPAPGAPSTEAAPGMPNPASVYCGEQGGTLEIRSAADGSQTGYCLFPDGSECEEWAFYRNECKPGDSPSTAPAPAGTSATAPAAPAASADELADAVEAGLPPGAFEGLTVVPLDAQAANQPLWAVHSYGMRNFDLDPVMSHFVATYTQAETGWQELARLDLDVPEAGGDPAAAVMPDFVPQNGVQQVQIDPDRVWLAVDGGAGAHSGTFQVLSFDGQSLRQEIGAMAASPGAGWVDDVDGDGQNDVVLNATDPYVFCYACGVQKPGYAVSTWLDNQFAPVGIADMLMEQQGQPYYEPNREAVRFAEAGLWSDALAKIGEARDLAGSANPPTESGSLRWNEALIKLNHDAYRDAVGTSAYPLLANVFYGDYRSAVNLMRPVGVRQIFSPDTPLIKGTVAEGWEDALETNILNSASAALAVQPDLAPAYFLRAWAAYLADPADPQVQEDLAQAATLAPDDPLYAAAAATLRPR